jgi:hypothetical protein
VKQTTTAAYLETEIWKATLDTKIVLNKPLIKAVLEIKPPVSVHTEPVSPTESPIKPPSSTGKANILQQKKKLDLQL